MTATVRVHRYGGPEVLVYEEIEVGAPGPGQIKLKQHAAGVNFIDTYIRNGSYKVSADLPLIIGHEGAGEVIAVGPGVEDLKVGDRVAYGAPLGGYAEERLLYANRAVILPDNISFEQAAAMMHKGMTAEYLLRRVYKVQKGDNILVHAAAGGVGLILCQWGQLLGANVIGTVGSEDKGKLAIANGCDHVIFYRHEDFPARVREITNGDRCAVVYDGIGKATFPGSLDCLRRFGTFVSFGNASGDLEPFDINILSTKGSLFATRPSLGAYTAKRADLVSIANNLFDVVSSGKVTIPIQQKYQLKNAAKAHQDLESRNTTGSTILIP